MKTENRFGNKNSIKHSALRSATTCHIRTVRFVLKHYFMKMFSKIENKILVFKK